MAAIGLVSGPLVHYWYKFLDGRLPGSALRTVIKKVLMEMTLAVPFNLCFICGICVLNRFSFAKTIQEVKDKLPLLVTFDIIVWSFLQSINFAFVPVYFRVVGMKFNEFLYVIIASHIINNNYDYRTVGSNIKKKIMD